jgi:hypothetical protein
MADSSYTLIKVEGVKVGGIMKMPPKRAPQVLRPIGWSMSQ